jgi:hypothetical protein
MRAAWPLAYFASGLGCGWGRLGSDAAGVGYGWGRLLGDHEDEQYVGLPVRLLPATLR